MNIFEWYDKRVLSKDSADYAKAMSIKAESIGSLLSNENIKIDLLGIVKSEDIVGTIKKLQSRLSDSLNKNDTMSIINRDAAISVLTKVYDYFLGLRDFDLNKKVDDKLWNRFQVHNDSINKEIVDPSFHLQISKPHKEHMDALKSPETMKPHEFFHSELKGTAPASATPESGSSIANQGVTPKLVHNVGENTYMMKPYHIDVDPGTETYTKHPIQGWATMAFKGLCDAGKIGHLCEDVHLAEHNGVPATMHKFAKNFTEYGRLSNRSGDEVFSVNPLHHSQISVMDYLTNNMDRHSGNIMVSNHDNESGHRDLLAIDNERAFQYHQHPLSKFSDSVHSSLVRLVDQEKKSAIGMSEFRLPENHDASKGVAKWWNENKHNINSEFNRHVNAIKDSGIREHIRTNFTDRFNAMDDALGSHPDGYEDWKMDVSAPLTKYEPPKPPSIARFEKKAEKLNPVDVLGGIADIVNKHGVFLDRDYRHGLSQIAYSASKRLSPEESVDMYHKLHTDPRFARESVHQYIVPYHNILSKTLGQHDSRGILRDHPDSVKTKQLFKNYYEQLPDASPIKDKLKSWYDSNEEKGWDL